MGGVGIMTLVYLADVNEVEAMDVVVVVEPKSYISKSSPITSVVSVES